MEDELEPTRWMWRSRKKVYLALDVQDILHSRMKAAFQTRVLAIALAIATLAVCVFACVNLAHENNFDVPTDGIGWTEAQGGLEAARVPADSPGERAGIRKGDILVAIDDHPTPRLAPFEYVIYHDGVWAHSTYTICGPSRDGESRAASPSSTCR